MRTWQDDVCKVHKMELCYYFDNMQNMQREAIGISSGTVHYSISATVLVTSDERMKEVIGNIAEAPWGTFEKTKERWEARKPK